MGTRILVVADAFELLSRGMTALTPALDWDGDDQHRDVEVELRRPNGTRSVVPARLLVEHFFPGGYRRIVHISLPKAEVPAGTEVWTTND